MTEEELKKIFLIAIEITNAKKEVTITHDTLKYAFRIAYLDSPYLNDILINGYHYVSLYIIDYKTNFCTSYKIYNKIFRNFLKDVNDDTKYKIASTAIPFLCGVADRYDEIILPN